MPRYVAGKAEASLRRVIATWLKKHKGTLIEAALKSHGLAKVGDWTDSAPWDELALSVNNLLVKVALDTAKKALVQLGQDDEAIVEMVSKNAIAWAKDRAAELVGKKWVGDQLLDNPKAEWAIDESTRIMLNDAIAAGVEDGLSADALADSLSDNYAFSRDRAYTIARTELAYAHTQGNLQAWAGSGVVEAVESILSPNHTGDDECNLNADAGPVPLGSPFPSGDDGPPYHPNCECALVAVLVGQQDEDESED